MTTKPDLLQVVLSLGAGGTERLVVDMCLRLKDDANIQVVCLDEAGEWANFLTEAGINVTALHRPPGFNLSLSAGMSVHDSLAVIEGWIGRKSPFVRTPKVGDEGEAYARKLESAGVATELHRMDGLIHAFFSTARMIPAGRAGIEIAVAGLRRAHGL